ncbi:MAG: hypothetical protein FWF78_02150 [Defluviitaleaceae bacterium]|nr:hypothetical protein [Defluviitaleaceae bacterium]
MTTVYLDNCCFNRPFDNQLHPIVQLETQAKLLIQSEAVRGNLNLVWSFMLTHENSDNPYDDRREQIALWKNVAKTVIAPTPQILTQTKDIEKLGIRTKDAMHIACAIDGKSDYFIATDKKVLNKTIQSITIINPMEFVRRHFNVS